MSKIFPKINVKFYSNVISHNQLMNMFSYYITTHFITSNKDYNSSHNFHLMYQMYLKSFFLIQLAFWAIKSLKTGCESHAMDLVSFLVVIKAKLMPRVIIIIIITSLIKCSLSIQ